MRIDDTWSDIKESLSQEPYANRGWLSVKDGWKLFVLWLVVCLAGWWWHDWAGNELPSSEVMEFAKHASIALAATGFAAGGMAHARRRKP